MANLLACPFPTSHASFMADLQPTPEELHYGRAAFEAANTRTPWENVEAHDRCRYAAMAAAARSAPVYVVPPAESLYDSLMRAVADSSERTSPREDRAIVYAVARWLMMSASCNLARSTISDLYDLAKERK